MSMKQLAQQICSILENGQSLYNIVSNKFSTRQLYLSQGLKGELAKGVGGKTSELLCNMHVVFPMVRSPYRGAQIQLCVYPKEI